MCKINKTVALMLTLIIAMSCLTLLSIKPASAQTMPKPSVPKFTIQTQTQNNTTTITLTIINQPFDAISQYPDGFFYNVAISVDGKNWSYLYHVEDASDWYPEQSNSSTTVLAYVAGETMYYPMNASQGVGVIPESGEVAFKVQAMIGHRDRAAFENGFMPYVLVGEKSDWSNKQTVTIPESNTSPSPTSPMPTINTGSLIEPFPFPLLIIASVIIAVVILSILHFRRHRKTAMLSKQKSYQAPSVPKISKYPIPEKWYSYSNVIFNEL